MWGLESRPRQRTAVGSEEISSGDGNEGESSANGMLEVEA
jgi:hypothetical protein